MKVKYEDRGCNINTLNTYDSTVLVYRQTKAEIVGESIYESTNTPNVYLQCVGIKQTSLSSGADLEGGVRPPPPKIRKAYVIQR
jgi:hypothetical protein